MSKGEGNKDVLIRAQKVHALHTTPPVACPWTLVLCHFILITKEMLDPARIIQAGKLLYVNRDENIQY